MPSFDGTHCEPITIEATNFIPGMGICLDIQFDYNGMMCKTFIPLNKIKRILPHKADRSWTRIYWTEDMSDGYFTIPLEYNDLVKYLKTLAFDEEDNK